MKMAAGWRIDDLFKAALPGVTAMVFVVIAAVPYDVPYLATVMPWLGLMPVYYWSIHEPRYLPPAVAFLIGLWQDIVTGGPLGLAALVFLLVRHFVTRQRHIFYRKAFLVGWWGFALVTLLAGVSGWMIASLYYDTLLPSGAFFAQAILTVMVYPIIAWLLGALWGIVQ